MPSMPWPLGSGSSNRLHVLAAVRDDTADDCGLEGGRDGAVGDQGDAVRSVEGEVGKLR
jgi:hypothetical protein